ncbi:MAG: T9SS type A sorting domain-containing protein [candidate division Zixibacteria bacterium]|nr:T9SS type A sorting domain-containing protein [candidate division Zixibacteria bacterium]
MTKRFYVIAAIAALIVIQAATAFAIVEPRGTEETFDIATWNVEQFPKRGQRTIDTLAILINDLELDLIAMQEITDTLAFRDLVSQLDGWEGLYSPDYSGLKTGVLYRTDQVTVVSWEPIFWNEGWEFPRPPIRLTIEVELPSGRFDFFLIVMHLKAMSDETSQERRRLAILMLKDYLDELVPYLPEQDWLIVGDWNDQLDDPEADNVFWPLLQDDLYHFLTLPMAGNPYWSSYPYLNSLIDHIMVTTDALDEYGLDGLTETLRLDDDYSNYDYVISDHRPVMSQFTDLPTTIDDETPLPTDFGLTSYPNPFNASANIAFSLENSSSARIDIYDCLGRHQQTLIDKHLQAGHYSAKFNADDLPSGMYFAKLTTGDRTAVIKLNLIK